MGAAVALPITFSFQQTDSATNLPIGAPNTPVDIPPGGAATFVLSLTPQSEFSADVGFVFTGSNTTAAASLTGINTLQLSASATPVPDVIALAATITNDGIVNIPGDRSTGAFAVATVNNGVGASITVSAAAGPASSIPVSLSLCRTNPATAECLALPAPIVTTQINAGETPTFSIFATGSGTVPFDAATNRIFVRFSDSAGVLRGSTSVAVRTQ